jgi:hypothetical protein
LRLAVQDDPALLRRRESLLLIAKSWLRRVRSDKGLPDTAVAS